MTRHVISYSSYVLTTFAIESGEFTEILYKMVNIFGMSPHLFVSWYSSLLSDLNVLLAEFPRCYCGEIGQVVAFLTIIYFTKAYRPDRLIRIFQYRIKAYHLSLNPISTLRLECSTVLSL